MEIVHDALSYLRQGFAEINHLQGLIIALIAALLLPDWKRILHFTIGATLVHILVDILAPVFANNAPLRLPPLLHGDFWERVLILLLGYFIVISVLAIIKRVLLRR